MKFDHLLKIYWARYFLYGGCTFPFQTSFRNLRLTLPGLNWRTFKAFYRRFDINFRIKGVWNWNVFHWGEAKRRTLNIYFAKMLSVNDGTEEWVRINMIRHFLIRSYRGKAMALNKPCHGQRTRSNARTAYYARNAFKLFIAKLRQKQQQKRKREAAKKFDYRRPKVIKRRRRPSRRKRKMRLALIGSNLWFE